VVLSPGHEGDVDSPLIGVGSRRFEFRLVFHGKWEFDDVRSRLSSGIRHRQSHWCH
jgi:hypothetical protein